MTSSFDANSSRFYTPNQTPAMSRNGSSPDLKKSKSPQKRAKAPAETKAEEDRKKRQLEDAQRRNAEKAVKKEKYQILDKNKCIRIRKDFPDIKRIPVGSLQLPNVIKGYGHFMSTKLGKVKAIPDAKVIRKKGSRALEMVENKVTQVTMKRQESTDVTLMSTLQPNGNARNRASMADHSRLANKSFLAGYLETLTKDEKPVMENRKPSLSPQKVNYSSPLKSIGRITPRVERSYLTTFENKSALTRVQESMENLILNRSKDFNQELDGLMDLAAKEEITIQDLNNGKTKNVKFNTIDTLRQSASQLILPRNITLNKEESLPKLDDKSGPNLFTELTGSQSSGDGGGIRARTGNEFLIQETSFQQEEDDSVLQIDEDYEIKAQKAELQAAISEQQELLKKQKQDQIKYDARNVFTNIEISPKKLAKKALQDRAGLTIEPVMVTDRKSKNNVQISPRIQNSLRTLMASQKGSQLLLNASSQLTSIAKPSSLKKPLGSRTRSVQHNYNIGSSNGASGVYSNLDHAQKLHLDQTLSALAAKSKVPRITNNELRLKEVIRGRKTSLQYQKTADNVANALEFSLLDKKEEIKQKKLEVQRLRELAEKEPHKYQLPDINNKNNEPEESIQVQVLQDSVLYQMAHLDKLLKDCDNQKFGKSNTKRIIKGFDRLALQTDLEVKRLQSKFDYFQGEDAEDRARFDRDFNGKEEVMEFKRNKSITSNYIRENIAYKQVGLTEGKGPLWKAQTKKLYSKQFLQRFPEFR